MVSFNFLRRSHAHQSQKVDHMALLANSKRQIQQESFGHLGSSCRYGDHDGSWWCSRCGQQNMIKEQDGKHPFGQLFCNRCAHVFNDEDVSTKGFMTSKVSYAANQTTNAHTPIQVPFIPHNEPVPHGVVCNTCGLTHRGTLIRDRGQGKQFSEITFGSVNCTCGRQCPKSWYGFEIGSAQDWWDDPVTAEAVAMEQRLEKRLAQSAMVKPTDPVDHASGKLRVMNA